MINPDAMPAGEFFDFNADVGQVYALGLTYADHARETGQRRGPPAVFLKHCRPLAQDQPTVSLPAPHALSAALCALDPELAQWLTRQFAPFPPLLDYEVEIGIVLLEDVHEQQLGESAFHPAVGYFVANDLSARSIQIAGEGDADRLRFWSAAKSFPDFLPTGCKIWRPAQSHAGALPDLTLQTRVNGELRQSASTRDCLYSVRQMLQAAAASAPDGILRRNDLILTGTPAGIALSVPHWKRHLAALLPRRMRIRAGIGANVGNPRFLKPGDRLQFGAGWLGSRELTISP